MEWLKGLLRIRRDGLNYLAAHVGIVVCII